MANSSHNSHTSPAAPGRDGMPAARRAAAAAAARLADGRAAAGPEHPRALARRVLLAGGLAAGAVGFGVGAPAWAGPVPVDLEETAPAAPTTPTAPTAAAASPKDPDFHPVKFRLPEPSGRKALGTTSIHLIDEKRPDPRMPSGQRELMITLWYPATIMGSKKLAKYMPERTAREVDDSWTGEYGLALPKGTFDFANTETHSRVNAPMQQLKHPILLFSPGYQYSRFVNTAQAEDLASRGYVVVAMDHTHETPTEFPGGRFLPGVPASQLPDPLFTRQAVETRVADTRFVLDQLEKLAAGREVGAKDNELPKGLAGGLDVRRVGMFGIGLGGYATAAAMYADKRIGTGLNLDGTLQDDRRNGPVAEVATKGMDRPLLLWASDETQFTDPKQDTFDLSWATFWAVQKGGKLNLALKGAKQKAFTDYQFVFDQVFRDIYGDDPIITSVMTALVGQVDPGRSILAQREYLAAYFDTTLRRRPDALLRQNSPKFPEVHVQW
ncbi:lipase [Kribbella sandramycini]|uniref:Lipase n=1 Tax=Kribbella sandramycini TaxID=60450 RepID=A0A7Y4L6B1_9ACTN|nr:lipase [Kribbella sandramycini]MBB6566103.1 putative dienelactone hydrolase [Kribbella sandramycini]NOL45103.1 lipase [Kribbella sandramycini]